MRKHSYVRIEVYKVRRSIKVQTSNIPKPVWVDIPGRFGWDRSEAGRNAGNRRGGGELPETHPNYNQVGLSTNDFFSKVNITINESIENRLLYCSKGQYVVKIKIMFAYLQATPY